MSEPRMSTRDTKGPRSRKDISSARKARAIVQGLAQTALVILAMRDLRRRPEAEINGNKKLWTLVAFAPPFGPIAYFLFGRKRRTSA